MATLGRYKSECCTYQIIRKIGNGAFGEVLLGREGDSGSLVALKTIYIREADEGLPDNVVRELRSLQTLDHANVVPLLDVFTKGQSLVLVQQYCCTDLSRMLDACIDRPPERVIKGLLQQIVRGVAGCHEAGIMHRDLKPSNVLLQQSGVVRLADFGLARPVSAGTRPQYTHTVATRWYRAPELLYGSRHYSTSVDMWSVGCIFAEMLGLGPLIAGDTDIDQLGRMLHTLGAIDLEQWPAATQLPDWDKINFALHAGQPLERLLPDASAGALGLLKQLLRYNPEQRLSAAAALDDPYFVSHPSPASEDDIATFILGKHVTPQ